MDERFTLVVREGADTIHRLHPYEQCNTDDAEIVETLDELSAVRMIANGVAKACQHCRPMTDGHI